MSTPLANSISRRFPALPRRSLMIIGVLCAVVVSAPALWVAIGLGALVAIAIVVYVAYSVVRGDVSWILLAWVLLFPLGYYFLSFPSEHPLITFDRAVIGLLLAGMCFASSRNTAILQGDMRKSAVCWAVFLFAATLSLAKPGVTLGSLRVFVEGFVIPPLLAGFVAIFFSVEHRLRVLHLLTALMCLYAAPIGVAELLRGQDLMPMKDSGTYMAGSGLGELLRVNGPFQSNNSYALIGLVSLFFLLFLRRAIAEDMPRWQKIFHWFGVVAALLIALLPMFRSVMLTLVAIAFLHIWGSRSLKHRVVFVLVLCLLSGAFLILNAVMPDIYEERVSSVDNVTARVSQQLQNLDMFLKNPVLGVGIGNFLNVVKPVTHYSRWNPNGVDPLDAPHSNLAAILVETGVTGFVPYVLAVFFLALAFWRFRKSENENVRICWKYFVYIFLSYWISGMTLTSGHYGDLNIWYLFTLAVLYKYGMERSAPRMNELSH